MVCRSTAQQRRLPARPSEPWNSGFQTGASGADARGLEELWQPALMDEYLDYLDSQSLSRPHFALPWTAMPDVIPEDESGWDVRWLVPRSIECKDGKIIVRCNGKELTFAAEALPVLNALQEKGTCSIEELCSRVNGTLPVDQVRVFLRELVDTGLASIDRSRAEAS